MTRALASFVALILLLVPALALAAPQMKTSVTPGTIEVGDSATFSVAVAPGDKVTEAEMHQPPAGLSLTGQSLSPSFQITVNNGQLSQVVTARATFRIRATREGTYTLGPVTVVADGARLTSERATLRVVAKGTLPQRQPDPLDPFGMFQQFQQQFGQQLDQFPNDTLEPNFPIDPKLSLDHAPNAGTFLHAAVDKTQAVVGEQVTLSVYIYADVTQSEPQLADPHEVGTSDFLRRSLVKDDASIERSGYARVGGRTYAVALLRKYALFPLHAGDLEIQPMRLNIGRGERSSETLTVHVTEPPMDHRPAGYVVGDVGHFDLSADVAPREVERGAAVAVNVALSGTGNLPSSLVVPTRPGVTWLEPDVKEDLHADQDVWGGTRRFSYIVQPTKEGDLDLGDIAVSYWDPHAHAYGIAKATLGTIHVKPGAAPVASESAKLLSNMPQPRLQMGATRSAEAHLDDSNVFWGLLAMPTMLFGLAISGRRVSRVVAERARERKTSPAAELKLRLRALDAAVAGDDARAIDGASIRALESGAAAHAGVNVRGVGGEEVASVLTRAGVSPETSGQLRDLLDACAAARFSPDGAELSDARDRAERSRAVIQKLAGAADEGRPSER
ncbi:MAG TPA: BatD family protein [Polyangiaceae bacterium]|jgi:hypothetical protein